MCCQDFLPFEKNSTKRNAKKSNYENILAFPPSLPKGKKIPLTGTSNLKIYLILFSQDSTTGEMNFKIQRPLQHLGTCWDK